MSSPTARQISAAHDAFEDMTQRWRLRKVANYGIAHDTWVLENIGSPAYDAGTNYADEIAAHRFDGPDANRAARLCYRNKCLVAALTAALSVE